MTPPALPLVVFSHLRWDFVYQRPQHVLSRIARTRPVVVIEEPVHTPGEPSHWARTTPAPGVEVYRPHTPIPEGGFSDLQLPALQDLLDELATQRGLYGAPVWLYTPMALPLAERLDPAAVVYDCMDELSAFAFAPPQLLEREQALLERASVVFTGGPSLYRAKRERHPYVYSFSSSVDAAHFGRAKARAGTPRALEEPTDQAALPPGPRLGYFGVVDERMDLRLLAGLAAARHDWQVVVVGPVVKVDPAALPQAPNLHYLGGRSYDALPAYLAGWDVALLPFAMNEATRYISPTKTLEYMAAERPIVSTPITDVAEPYGDVVRLAQSPEAFAAACHAALHESPAEREWRTERMRGVLAQTSWDTTAARMGLLLDAVCEGRPPVLD